MPQTPWQRRPAMARLGLLWLAATTKAWPTNDKDLKESMEAYAPKSCKFTLLPPALATRAFTAYTGEARVNDVFGMPSTIKRHIMRLDVSTESLLTLQAEVHRDTPTTLNVDVWKRGEVGKAGSRIIYGKTMLGAGGEATKAFVHGLLGEKDKEVDIVFEMMSVEVAASQVDARVREGRCWPVRVDLLSVPSSRASLYWPNACPAKNQLPAGLGVNRAGGSQITVLGDSGLSLKPQADDKHYAWKLGDDDRPWEGFGRSLWSGTIEAPTRLHRFVRFFMRANFRFASGPLQLVIELFELKDTPDGTADAPKCSMGCLAGVPVYNGQIVDHAMPTGFRYKLWLLAANLPEWLAAVPGSGRQCLEFDFDYDIRFEERMTPFEVGPQASLCEFARLPAKIVQTPSPRATDKLASSSDQLVAGRSIWIRDRWGFPPDESSNMEHTIEVEVAEPCVFRATTHHSEGVDVFVALSNKGSNERACQTTKHPGPVPRQTIFCVLQPGTYTITFFADYPLGGLAPCSDFFAQVALRPTALANEDKNKECVQSASDLTTLSVQQSLALTTTPRWKSIKVPISFAQRPSTTTVWSQEITVEEQDIAQRMYLRLVVHSDYVSSDLRFQVKYHGKYVADTQVTSFGYADMIGPLDPGAYRVDLYYVSGMGAPKDFQLCSTSMVDLRVVSRSQYQNRSWEWMCHSSRVPPPEVLAPQPDEQVLIDSEYVVPEMGFHIIRIKLTEARVVRVMASSADADFWLELGGFNDNGDRSVVASGSGNLEALVGKGTYSLRLMAKMRSMGSGKTCTTFLLNMLLHSKSALPLCPWAAGSSDRSAGADAQRAADDHIGSLLLDLVPKRLSKDIDVKPPKTLWMSQGMEKTFEMQLDTTSAIRMDVAMQPPFLPLEISVRRKRDSGKLEAAIVSGEWTESRLMLMNSDLSKGTYVVEIKQPRTYQVQGDDGGDVSLKDLCSHVTISAEVGVSSKEAVNTMRSELLDLPDLLALQPLPPSLNSIGAFATSMLPLVSTQVYRFSKDSVSASTSLRVDDKAVVRIVCEPADLSNADISARLVQNDVTIAGSDTLGQLVYEVQQPGLYSLVLEPKASAPFLVTVGLATESRLKEDLALLDSGTRCASSFPDIASGVRFSPRGWTIGPAFVRLQPTFLGTEGELTRIPITISVPSILYIEVGSALPLDLVRIALQVPEGLWVGEQRGLRNSLEIELPPGGYKVQIAQPRPSRMEHIKRCLDFSVLIAARPVNPDAISDAAEGAEAKAAASGSSTASGEVVKKEELAAREEAAVEAAPCFSMGTVPMPLDFSDPGGGSQLMGGPLDKDGRLLVRTHVLITDMHNGRKKVFLSTKGLKLQMKVGVMLGGHTRLSMASQLSFSVSASGQQAMDPLETWSTEEGWERIYILDGTVTDGYWLAFHHPHRERSESACVHFGLEMEIHPVSDNTNMINCGSGAGSPQDMLPASLDVGADLQFKYVKPLMYLKQEQKGFLNKIRFTLKVQSWVGAELGYNFFTSHAEMDIVLDRSADKGGQSLAFAEADFLNHPNQPLNTHLVLSRVLPPGDYVLRIADDHYAKQLGDSTGCFPFSFELRVVPEGAKPSVVSVRPHPSVPLMRGVDLVLTFRFSEPPAGSLADVVKAISLGGVQAITGGSMNAMAAGYAVKKSTTVQASTSEGHLVWVIGWSAQAIAEMKNPKLVVGLIKSNLTGRLFRFKAPTYQVVDKPIGAPWSGGSVLAEPGTPATAGQVSLASSDNAGDGDAAPSSGSDDSDTGTVRKETGGSAGAPPPVVSAKSASEDEEDDDDDIDHAPKVQEWNPMDDDGEQSHRRRRQSKTKDTALASAPAADSTSSPGGYNFVKTACVIALCVFALQYYWPRLKRYVPVPMGGSASTGAGRFKDIGHRSSEEEIGLVSASIRGYDDDDDML